MSKAMAPGGQCLQRGQKLLDRKVAMLIGASQAVHLRFAFPLTSGTHPRGCRPGTVFFAIPVVLDGVFSICTSALNAERELFTPRDVQRTGLV